MGPYGDAGQVTPGVVRGLYLRVLLPILGMLLFAAGGALGLRAFAHNSSLSCAGPFASAGGDGCTHYSYLLPIGLGIGGMLLVIGGGMYASYYAAQRVGLPVLAAWQQRGRGRS